MNALRKSLLSFLELSKQSFGLPRWSPALNIAAQPGHQDRGLQPAGNFLDDLKEGILRAVQTNRRSVQRRQWRRVGMPQFQSQPRRDLKVCPNCGNYHEGHTLCGHCYAKVREETELVKQAMSEAYGRLKPIEHEFRNPRGDRTPPEDQPKRLREIPKKGEPIFSKNLLQKENQV